MLNGDKVSSVSFFNVIVKRSRKHWETFVIPYFQVPPVFCPTIFYSHSELNMGSVAFLCLTYDSKMDIKGLIWVPWATLVWPRTRLWTLKASYAFSDPNYDLSMDILYIKHSISSLSNHCLIYDPTLVFNLNYHSLSSPCLNYDSTVAVQDPSQDPRPEFRHSRPSFVCPMPLFKV